MEERNLIKSGPGSYVVTVPISWIRKNKLDKGSTIYIAEEVNNIISIYPKFREIKHEDREITIDCIGIKGDDLINQIISAYLNNSHTIKITKINAPHKKEAKDLVHLLPGLHIAEETETYLIIQDLISLDTISLSQIVRRIDFMINGEFVALQKKDSGNIVEIDDNIFGQTLLIKKILKLTFRDPSVQQKTGLTIEEAAEHLVLIDQLANISNKIKNIVNAEYPKTKKESLTAIINILETQYRHAMKSFYSRDRELAQDVFGLKFKIYAELQKHISEIGTTVYNECILFDKSCRIIARIAYDHWKK